MTLEEGPTNKSADPHFIRDKTFGQSPSMWLKFTSFSSFIFKIYLRDPRDHG